MVVEKMLNATFRPVVIGNYANDDCIFCRSFRLFQKNIALTERLQVWLREQIRVLMGEK